MLRQPELVPPASSCVQPAPGGGCCARPAGETAAVSRAAAAHPRLLHRGAQLRGAVTQQEPPDQELLSLLGGIIGNSVWYYRINYMEKAHGPSGEPICHAICGLCTSEPGWIHIRMPRCSICDQCPQLSFDMTEGKMCVCCEESPASKCLEKENVLKLVMVHSCNAVHLLLKKVFFALCALNALTTTVCLVAAALRYLQLLTTRRPCTDESQVSVEEAEEQDREPDIDVFVPPAPPPSYFSTFYSNTPRMSQRMVGNEVIPLPHIYGSRFKGVEVFCPMEPPPSYESVVGQSPSLEQTYLEVTDGEIEATVVTSEIPSPTDVAGCSDAEVIPVSSSTVQQNTEGDPANKPQRKRSHSDPVIHDPSPGGAVPPSCEAATQTELRPPVTTVTLRRALRAKAVRSRPRSLVDYKSYMDTKLLVTRFLEEPSSHMSTDVRELVESIKTVLKSDEEHMDEAILSANFLEQVMGPSQQTAPVIRRQSSRRQPGVLHLDSCGDLSTFCTTQTQRDNCMRTQRTARDRPHSLIGVVRETIL
ncbi:endosomal transmembrane epsin interactor 1 isoform X1 [Eleutherodactylus coqui]|uniref:endosomal transmembrane epsin interactor 1 isoform X1 n=1 Tax=Eleutherodactylus coqui TaxID=57060 RepID=UPI003462A2D3